jgi:uncharacterized protein (TIGR03790 family)
VFTLLSTALSLAQQGDYNDVAVIINTNSTISDSIGTYFSAQRGIPSSNIIRIAVPTLEEIDSVTFENLRQQVETLLAQGSALNKINYLVTTKGVPLKVNRGNIWSYNSGSSSVESELALILGPYSSYIGNAGRFNSPYYNQQVDFTRKKFGFFLVTRLDGYSFSGIKSMIDRAVAVDPSVFNYGKFVLDADGSRSMVNGSLNGFMKAAVAQLSTRSVLTDFDSTTQYLTGRSDVLGYVSWGSNDASQSLYTDNAKPYHSFLPGSIAETYVSTSARSFATPPEYGQSLIADILAQGVNGAKGYVYEPFSSAIANVEYAFPMYADGFTMAESFSAASLYLSWMDVVIGDPKMRINPVRITGSSNNGNGNKNSGTLPVELVSFEGNSTGKGVQLRWSTATETHNAGFEVERKPIGNSQLTIDNWIKVGFVAGAGSSNASRDYTYTDVNVTPARYTYRLRQIDNDGTVHVSSEIIVEVRVAASVASTIRNYPNPFNPTTTINVSLQERGNVSLKIYNIAGQEVATLLNGFAEAGQTAVRFDASSLPSGTYVSRLQTENSTVTQKMLLVK